MPSMAHIADMCSSAPASPAPFEMIVSLSCRVVMPLQFLFQQKPQHFARLGHVFAREPVA